MVLPQAGEARSASRVRLRRAPARLAALRAQDGARRCHRQVLESFAERPAARPFRPATAPPSAGACSTPAGRRCGDRALNVVETFDDGARLRVRRHLGHDRADGSFVTRLAPGPSRRSASVRRRPPAHPGHGRELRLAVRTGVRLRVSTSRAGSAAPRSSSAAGSPTRARRSRTPGCRSSSSSACRGRLGRVPDPPDRRRRALPLPVHVHRRRQRRGPLPLPRPTPPSGGWPFLPGTSRPLAVTG